MKGIRFTPKADADFDDCFAFLAAQSMPLAERFFEAVHSTTRQLSTMPRLGTRCEIRNAKLSNLRRWSVNGFKNYIVYYREVRGGISIIRILHGARDRDAILESDDD